MKESIKKEIVKNALSPDEWVLISNCLNDFLETALFINDKNNSYLSVVDFAMRKGTENGICCYLEARMDDVSYLRENLPSLIGLNSNFDFQFKIYACTDDGKVADCFEAVNWIPLTTPLAKFYTDKETHGFQYIAKAYAKKDRKLKLKEYDWRRIMHELCMMRAGYLQSVIKAHTEYIVNNGNYGK